MSSMQAMIPGLSVVISVTLLSVVSIVVISSMYLSTNTTTYLYHRNYITQYTG